jgi:hypothetical protein
LGYRRLNQMLTRKGTVVNLKKVRRLLAEERLQVKKRRKSRTKACAWLPTLRSPGSRPVVSWTGSALSASGRQ